MTTPLHSLEATQQTNAARATAARKDAQVCRDLADQLLSHELKFSDPLFDASWRARNHYMQMALVFDDLAATFEMYALDEHIARGAA